MVPTKSNPIEEKIWTVLVVHQENLDLTALIDVVGKLLKPPDWWWTPRANNEIALCFDVGVLPLGSLRTALLRDRSPKTNGRNSVRTLRH